MKPINSPPTNTSCSSGRESFEIDSIQPAMLMKWAEALNIYLENLPGSTLHVVLNGYSPRDEHTLKQIRSESIIESKISDLSRQLPKSDK